ncbi:Hypothetical Protein FCC1311_074232 [Hondaea fermentalgiana]|uniref:GYF domain-containing protein n=1 Tax=Hondaea fermentalgiana TaxID=2315210 RepID=A0A2R5GJY0_9STRA|nr:Hypothetical Protein FCC1311_074232 [Hondaea fermentalgiana]|eukprot:GBG31202.1 Hypothetical Protein FCC1311_074232 [Hondaea fermentalgiana]
MLLDRGSAFGGALGIACAGGPSNQHELASRLGRLKRNDSGNSSDSKDVDAAPGDLFSEKLDANTPETLSLPRLGPVQPLWKVIMDALFLAAESDESTGALHCLDRLQRVCSQDAVVSDALAGTSSTMTTGDSLSSDLLPISPSNPAEAMRAIAAILFSAEECITLLDCLLELDEINAELHSSSEIAEEVQETSQSNAGQAAAENEAESSHEKDAAANPGTSQPPQRCVLFFFECLDVLQACADRDVRRWAVKGMWRALHACAQHDRCDEFLVGLEAFECGMFSLELLSVQTLVAAPPEEILGQLSRAALDKPRHSQMRNVLVRRAFAQSLLTRAVQLEQRGRRRGSRTSFALGSVGSQSGHSSSENGPFSAMGSARREASNTSFETGSISTHERASGSVVARATPKIAAAGSFVAPSSSTGSSLSRLERKPQMAPIHHEGHSGGGAPAGSALGVRASNLSSADADARTSDLMSRRSDLFGRTSDLRMSGLRSSRLAQLVMQARRSSMSLVGSVHTFRSDDLASCVRDGSALGLEANFHFPRLTDISIPEHEAFSADKRIWTSKSAATQSWSASHDVGSMRNSFAGGIEYMDCATLFELITGQLVEPLDAHHFQTTNPFTQLVSVAAQELVPVLLCMLGWMSDNLVRKEFVGALFTLCASSAQNLHIFHSSQGWRTGLLRLLQTIPRDRDFRDEATDYILHRIVEMLCMSTLRSHPTRGLYNLRGLDQIIFETAVLSGWNRDSVNFVRNLLCAQADALQLQRAPLSASLRFFRIVEIFLLYMPSKDEALLGYSNQWSRVARRARRTARAGSERSSQYRDSLDTSALMNSEDEGHGIEAGLAAGDNTTSLSSARANAERRAARADSESKMSMISLPESEQGTTQGDVSRESEPRSRDQCFVSTATADLDEERKFSHSVNDESDIDVENDTYDQELAGAIARMALERPARLRASPGEYRDEVHSDIDDEDDFDFGAKNLHDDDDDECEAEDQDEQGESAGEYAGARSGRGGYKEENWLWEPVLSQCSPIEMAENQVDFLEFQLLELRRGVDFGMHLDKECTHFVDRDFAQHMLTMLENVVQAFANKTREHDHPLDMHMRGHEGKCIENLCERMHALVDALDRAEAVIEEEDALEMHESKHGLRRRIFLFDTQYAIIQARGRISKSCACLYCANMRLTDEAVATGLERLSTRPGSSRSAHGLQGLQGGKDGTQLRNESEHLVLREGSDAVERPRPIVSAEAPDVDEALSRLLDARRICPICKEHVDVSMPASLPHWGLGSADVKQNALRVGKKDLNLLFSLATHTDALMAIQRGGEKDLSGDSHRLMSETLPDVEDNSDPFGLHGSDVQLVEEEGEDDDAAEDGTSASGESGQAQAVNIGSFLYIDRTGAQQGPVSGEELYQLAVNGSIDANTHVWTPGLAQWKPLSQLSQHSL